MAIRCILSACAKNQRLIALDVPILKEWVVEHRVAIRAARDQRKTFLLAEAGKLALNLNGSVAAVERLSVRVDVVKVYIALPGSAERIGMRLSLCPEVQQVPVRIGIQNPGLQRVGPNAGRFRIRAARHIDADIRVPDILRVGDDADDRQRELVALHRAFAGVDDVGLADGVAAVIAALKRAKAEQRGLTHRNRAVITRAGFQRNRAVRGICDRAATRHLDADALRAVKRAAGRRNLRLLRIARHTRAVRLVGRRLGIEQEACVRAPVADIRVSFRYEQFIQKRTVRLKEKNDAALRGDAEVRF